jgi:hypothetical protein
MFVHEEEDDEDDDIKPVLTMSAYVSGEVSIEIVVGNLVCDEAAKFVDHYVYHALQAAARGEHFKMPPELTKEEAL